jgi:hypothetical protein
MRRSSARQGDVLCASKAEELYQEGIQVDSGSYTQGNTFMFI